MERLPDWDEYFLNQLPNIASKSKDPSTKVGAIIAGPDHGTKATGFNGFARGIEEGYEIVPERWERPEKYEWVVHAERNAIYYAAKHGISLKDCTIYVDWAPCGECSRAIIQVGIKRIVIDADSPSSNNVGNKERWGVGQERAAKMLKEAGVEVIHYKRSK